MGVLQKIGKFAGNTFAIWVLVAAGLAIWLPEYFTWIGSYITILLGIVMFGMGMTLKLDDFKLILQHPKGVIIGIVSQFVVMPLLAFALAKIFNLPPEIAVGVILVGCCPGGTSSNVMTFLAKGNTALSVTITSCTTLLAPFVTPALIYLLASEWLPVSFMAMFMSVIKVVLIPIVLGIVAQFLFRPIVEKSIDILPTVSVIAIVMIVAAVVSGSRDKILETGLIIFAIVILHNGLGYLIGFLVAKLFKLQYDDQKAISIEVGMQNSGLGAQLAMAHFDPVSAVPSAIFSFWHNISGPILATYWGSRANKKVK
ncbi:bile acid:sodium symporter family protein [Solibacillus sp. FSL W7-1472]|uniref:Predicted Na+-dependent transporter n=2 Tax=Solibacillus TaxID=648800 RepID=F2F1R6_SOLSS|nr:MULTISPECIES: bile acid:sodium symporter family protein [Solibacillus]AMO85169.1 sodium transporter [Solibacillus silvestris]EKB44740.1 bile acid transporter [Solibacillus isronensis B3W22]OBW55867.1 sodium transporter [Solibacillus silvestris]BAK16929.1 predicted Na+-dependent transporter [Solibacillus silvestris StLB046]